jgi:hypothetical protein
LLDHIKSRTKFDLLAPMSARRARLDALRGLPAGTFTPSWAGYATAKLPHTPPYRRSEPFHQYDQRTGKHPEEYYFKVLVATTGGDEVLALSDEFPER